MEEAISRIARLDFAGARPILMDLLAGNPDHKMALEHLFNVDKQQPDDPEFDKIAKRFLSVLVKSKSDADKAWKAYTEYMRISKQPDLPVELQIRLFSIFCENSHLEDAERIMSFLVSNKPDHPYIPSALLRLIRSFEKSYEEKKADQFRLLLTTKYSMSQEARLAGVAPAK